jgi:predicted small secreted protein
VIPEQQQGRARMLSLFLMRKVLYMRSHSSRMMPLMRRQQISWFLALIVVAGALVLTSCMNQEGIGPGAGELKDKPSTGY